LNSADILFPRYWDPASNGLDIRAWATSRAFCRRIGIDPSAIHWSESHFNCGLSRKGARVMGMLRIFGDQYGYSHGAES